MNKQNSKMFSLMFNFGITLVLLLVTVFAFLSVHYGWFAENRTVKGTGMNISIDYDDTVALYYVYKYDTVREEASKSSKIEGGSIQLNSITNLQMLSYDKIFLDRNSKNPVIFRIQVSGTKLEKPSGSITINLQRTVHEDATSTNLVRTRTVNGKNSLYAYISSCVYFKSAALSTLKQYLQTNPEDENGLWENAITAFNSVSNNQKFISVETTDGQRTYTKVESLSFEIPYTAEDWVNDTTLNVYIYMNYDSEFANYAYADSELNPRDDLTKISLDLINDFVMINAKHSKGGNQ